MPNRFSTPGAGDLWCSGGAEPTGLRVSLHYIPHHHLTTKLQKFDVLTLSMDAARNTFYRIHYNNEQSGIIDETPKRLDFRLLSVTLLATIAYQNKWGNNRPARE